MPEWLIRKVTNFICIIECKTENPPNETASFKNTISTHFLEKNCPLIRNQTSYFRKERYTNRKILSDALRFFH